MFVVRFTKRLFGKGKRGIAPIPALPALAPALPSPLLINALQLHRLDNEAESVTLMPSANVDTDEERRDKEVTIPCDWATDSQGHPNAVYVKSQLQIFVKEVIVKAFPALMPVVSYTKAVVESLTAGLLVYI
ncbi:hypothetical protein QFC19_001746 [Naganishia cerealis]|uniref:Uncharacterized protein n=1 Tax=Naganishia cerealis TaxID=610337 RepID=A0ACC2WFH3_9TREE|nr:hypothetical protein QFC19_001746 [Naganishia cerealis]